jgi:hypothetical protein
LKVDLHIHTTFSDGEHSPSEIMRLAKGRDITTLAITDHDSIDGLSETFQTAEIEVISGVELGVDEKESEIHILGYLFDSENKKLADALVNLRRGRDLRNRKILETLASLGIEIHMEEVARKITEGNAGRPHIAMVMVEKGYVASIQEAFEKFLGKGRPAYVEREKFTASDCIRLILCAHGVPVLAHPKFIKGDLEKIIREYVEYGLCGIEAYYSEHTEEETRHYRNLAERFNLITTGGTDYHGSTVTPHIELGDTFVPSDVVEKLKRRWVEIHGVFRDLREEDKRELLQMTKEQMGSIVFEAWNVELSESMVLSLFEERNNTYVLCVGKEILGYITIEDETDSLFIHSIILRKDMTGFDVGDVLMKRILAEAHERHSSRMRLNVQTPNTRAIHFYEKWGFKKTRELNNTIEMVCAVRN